MRYKVTEVTFHKPLPSLGSGAWYEAAAGKYVSADFDTDSQMLTLYPNDASPSLKKRRVPVGNIADLVFGPILANAK